MRTNAMHRHRHSHSHNYNNLSSQQKIDRRVGFISIIIAVLLTALVLFFLF